ncbi:MAG: hypothetical protein KAU20_02420 [Nanoarchaeota archaeon]|nr:hypothetical protein [Nanoarchaeota archaeon]
MNLKEIVQQLEDCEFTCQGGSITENAAFDELKKAAETSCLIDIQWLEHTKDDVLARIGVRDQERAAEDKMYNTGAYNFYFELLKLVRREIEGNPHDEAVSRSFKASSAFAIIQSAHDKALKNFPEFPADPIHAASILAEEAGEVCKAANQITYEDGLYTDLMKEAAHTGAMAARILTHILDMQENPSSQLRG